MIHTTPNLTDIMALSGQLNHWATLLRICKDKGHKSEVDEEELKIVLCKSVALLLEFLREELSNHYSNSSTINRLSQMFEVNIEQYVPITEKSVENDDFWDRVKTVLITK